ncbi:MAG TPA: hypothetical protein VNU72_00390 [Puia sp.]|jgi:hypothetical protein|nr:hypothetical protein [Puia sp.]
MKQFLLTVREKTWKDLYLPLLVFLLVFTIDKILLKFAGIALLYLLHPDFKFRSNLRKIPLFYLLLLALEVLKFLLLNRDFSWGHTVSFLLGCVFWAISFLSLHQLRTIVDEVDKERIYRTLTVFFLINVGLSAWNLLLAMYHSGSLNPFALEDRNYGNSTGDLIKGLFLGPSYLNMMISSFFLFFYLYRGKIGLAFIALFVILLTSCNFGNIILVTVLIACLIFGKNRRIRLSTAGFLAVVAGFYLLITPHNLEYLRDSIFVPKKQQQELIAYEKKAIADEKAHPAENTTATTAKTGENVQGKTGKSPAAAQTAKAQTARAPLESEAAKKPGYSAADVDALLAQPTTNIPDTQVTLTGKAGKLQSFKQTAQYLRSGVKPFLFGAGMGNFSSFLALRMAGVNKEEGSRLFTYLPSYTAPTFRANHYRIFQAIYGLPTEFHSAKHFPNSFLNQLFGEYGLVGALLFLLTYVLFFFKRWRQLTYGRYLLFLLGGYLLFDYLFEYLSVVTVFELLMFCDIHRAESAGLPPQPGQS